MANNKYRGELIIEFDRPRNFRLSFNEIIEAEELIGEQFDLSRICDSVKKIRAVLFVGLKGDDPELTLEKTGALIGLHDQPRVLALLMASVRGTSIAEVEKELADKPKNAVGAAAEKKSNGRSQNVSAGLPV